MVDTEQLAGGEEGDDMPVEMADVERLLEDTRRQIIRVEQGQDRQDAQQRAMDVAVAKLQQVMVDRGASCPWRVDIADVAKSAKIHADGIQQLTGAVSDLKVKVATIAAGGGVAGGLVAVVVRLVVDAIGRGG